jgi:TPR repeat protein
VDARKSYDFFLRAAQAEIWSAAWYVGMKLLNGEGVEANEAEAYRWVRKSGEGGDLEGQISTAVMLALGQGVAENDAEARTWYEKAAKRRSAHGMRGLGVMLYTGEGGPAETARGYAYLELAAEGGDENAGVILQRINDAEPPRAEIDRHKAAWIAANGRPNSDD